MPEAVMIAGAVIAFVYGAVIGSFLNVCIYRLPRGESIVSPPSHCPKCNTQLRTPDLVPIFSFLFLKRSCRYCKAPISWRYAIIESVTALLFLAVWLSLALRAWPIEEGAPPPMLTVAGLLVVLAVCAFVAAMVVTFVIDLETTYVIEPVTWVAMGAGVVAEVSTKWFTHEPLAVVVWSLRFSGIPAAVPGMLIGFLTFVAIDLFARLIFRKPGMGLGDAFIGAAIGAILGPGLALLVFGIAVVSGALVGIVVLTASVLAERRARKGVKASDAQEEVPPMVIPIGPSLVASLVLFVLVVVEAGVSRLLGPQVGEAGAGATIFALLCGLAMVAALVIVSRLTPEEAPLADGEPAVPEGGFYMPFGPFLTAAAVLVALAPTWVQDRTHDLWLWYLRFVLGSGS